MVAAYFDVFIGNDFTLNHLLLYMNHIGDIMNLIICIIWLLHVIPVVCSYNAKSTWFSLTTYRIDFPKCTSATRVIISKGSTHMLTCPGLDMERIHFYMNGDSYTLHTFRQIANVSVIPTPQDTLVFLLPEGNYSIPCHGQGKPRTILSIVTNWTKSTFLDLSTGTNRTRTRAHSVTFKLTPNEEDPTIQDSVKIIYEGPGRKAAMRSGRMNCEIIDCPRQTTLCPRLVHIPACEDRPVAKMAAFAPKLRYYPKHLIVTPISTRVHCNFLQPPDGGYLFNMTAMVTFDMKVHIFPEDYYPPRNYPPNGGNMLKWGPSNTNQV
nr:hypothetical protein [Salmonid herpesvirus 1]